MSAGGVFPIISQTQGPGPLRRIVGAIQHAVDTVHGHAFVAFHNHAPQIQQHLNNALDLRGHR